MNQDIKSKLQKFKNKYDKQGFIILGIFGSYARDEQNSQSDIDILYEITDDFYNKYPGWKILPIIENIQNEISNNLQLTADLTNKNALNEIGQKYILPEIEYV